MEEDSQDGRLARESLTSEKCTVNDYSLPVASQQQTVTSWNLLNVPIYKLMSARKGKAKRIESRPV